MRPPADSNAPASDTLTPVPPRSTPASSSKQKEKMIEAGKESMKSAQEKLGEEVTDAGEEKTEGRMKELTAEPREERQGPPHLSNGNRSEVNFGGEQGAWQFSRATNGQISDLETNVATRSLPKPKQSEGS